MQRKTKLIAAFSKLALLVVGQVSYAVETNQDNPPMMNGMTNMTNMMKMMDNPGMMHMMNTMNSPVGKDMMKSCSKFMESDKETKDEGITK